MVDVILGLIIGAALVWAYAKYIKGIDLLKK